MIPLGAPFGASFASQGSGTMGHARWNLMSQDKPIAVKTATSARKKYCFPIVLWSAPDTYWRSRLMATCGVVSRAAGTFVLPATSSVTLAFLGVSLGDRCLTLLGLPSARH